MEERMGLPAKGEFVGLGIYFEGGSRGFAEGLDLGRERKRRLKDGSQAWDPS